MQLLAAGGPMAPQHVFFFLLWRLALFLHGGKQALSFCFLTSLISVVIDPFIVFRMR